MRLPVLFAACAVSLFVLPAGAQSLKPGLWQIQHKMNNPEMNQQMAEMQKQMAAMSPQERKQMEAMMAQSGMRMTPGAAGGGMAFQMCMTKEMVERNEMPMEDGCRMTKQERSGNTMKMAFTCARPPSSGEGQVTFTGPEAYTSKMVVKVVEQGKTQTTTMETQGKWLKADCGNVKPPAQPKK
jgi:hypothetical protein